MAQTQLYPPEMVENLSAVFPRRAENSFAWGNAISYYLGLPQLRGFWPMSSVDENGAVYDMSGQGRTLSNPAGTTFGVDSLQPYATFNNATNYLLRATEPGLEITDALTLGAWIRRGSVGSVDFVFDKFATNQTAYRLFVGAPNFLVFRITTDGTTAVTVTSTETISANQWRFVCGRFTPSVSVCNFTDDVETINAAAIPATIFNSTGAFTVGMTSGLLSPFDGDITLAFICAEALSNAQIKALYYLTRPLFYGS